MNADNDKKIKIKSTISGDFDDEDNDTEGDSFKIFTKSVSHKEYDVYLSETITRNSDYYDLYNLLESATKKDTIRFHLNNYGGYVHTGNHLVSSLRSCKANTIMIVCAPVYSMGSLLALAGKNLYVHEPAFFMFHDYSGQECGKGSEMYLSMMNQKDYFQQLFTNICYPFLTHKEINSILDGKDLYVPYNSIQKRLKKIGTESIEQDEEDENAEE